MQGFREVLGPEDHDPLGSGAPFTAQFPLLPDVQGAIPDQIPQYLPIPFLCWDLCGGLSSFYLPVTNQMFVRARGL